MFVVRYLHGLKMRRVTLHRQKSEHFWCVHHLFLRIEFSDVLIPSFWWSPPDLHLRLQKNKHLKTLWKGNISRTKTCPNWTMWLFEDPTRFLKEGVRVKVTYMIISRGNGHYLTKIHTYFKDINKTLPAWIINFFLSRSAFLAAACRCNCNRFSAGFDFTFPRAIHFWRASLAL